MAGVLGPDHARSGRGDGGDPGHRPRNLGPPGIPSGPSSTGLRGAAGAGGRVVRRETKILGWMLGLLTVVLLAQGHHQVGYVRDEGVYFEASRNHAAWFRRLARSPSDALRPAVRDRHFGFNREHPPTMKSLAALSAMTLARPPTDEPGTGGAWPVMPEGAAMRLPAQIVAGLGVVLLFF